MGPQSSDTAIQILSAVNAIKNRNAGGTVSASSQAPKDLVNAVGQLAQNFNVESGAQLRGDPYLGKIVQALGRAGKDLDITNSDALADALDDEGQEFYNDPEGYFSEEPKPNTGKPKNPFVLG